MYHRIQDVLFFIQDKIFVFKHIMRQVNYILYYVTFVVFVARAVFIAS